ncbi:MAG: hypothetical protein ACYC1U_04405 [Candidatus Aquicultorales bacterium]
MQTKKILVLVAVGALLVTMGAHTAVAQPYVPSVQGQAAAAELIEDTDPRIVYKGDWKVHNHPGAFNNTCTDSTGRGDTASLTFEGTGVTFFTAKQSDCGIAKVYVDGVLKDTVDLYSADPQVRQRAFTTSGLSPGTHTITVEVQGEHHSPASGSDVMIDAFEVVR